MTRSLCAVERLPSPKLENFLLYHAVSADLLARKRRSRKMPRAQRPCIVQIREETNTEASLLNTPLAVSFTTLSTSNINADVAYLFRPARWTGG